MTTTFRDYQIVSMNPEDGTSVVSTVSFVSSLAEALAFTERMDGGMKNRIYGIVPADYELARSEGIHFNEADGLLVD